MFVIAVTTRHFSESWFVFVRRFTITVYRLVNNRGRCQRSQSLSIAVRFTRPRFFGGRTTKWPPP